MKHIFLASILSLAWIGQAGNGNVIVGNGNVMRGNGNMIQGNNDNVNGNLNIQIGDASSINGNNNLHVGNNQQIIGDNQYLNNVQAQQNPIFYNQGVPSIGWGMQVGVPVNNMAQYFSTQNLPANQLQQQNPLASDLIAKRLQLLNNLQGNLRVQMNNSN